MTMQNPATRFLISLLLAATLDVGGAALAGPAADDPYDDGSGGLQDSVADDEDGMPPEQTPDDPPIDGQDDPWTSGSDDSSGDDGDGPDATGSDDPPGDDEDGFDDISGDWPESRSTPNGKLHMVLKFNDDSVTPISGKFKYESDKKGSRFESALRIRIPDRTTGLNRRTARNALITVTLSDGSQPYAECQFGFDRFGRGAKARYAIVVKALPHRDDTAIRQHKGSCDTDLDTDGIQPGVPEVRPGDEALIEFHAEPAPAEEPATVELGQINF